MGEETGDAQTRSRTVNDVWITAARTVFEWAVRERMISSQSVQRT